MKGYKVADWKRSRIVGIACNTLEQLIEKGSKKLQLDAEQVVVRLQDGTYVDSEEYFRTLVPQTLFLLVLPDQEVLTGYELLYNMLSAVHKNYLNVGQAVSDFLSQDLKSKIREISSVLDEEVSLKQSQLSSREDDPSWFEGLETNSTSKEQFMFKRSQERIRGYLYKTHDDVKRSQLYVKNSKVRKQLDKTFQLFKTWLKEVRHFGCYFHRHYSNNGSLLKSYCNNKGQFHCQGKWNDEKCLHLDQCSPLGNPKHSINPYESKEARVVFSTWNLDHGIERARQVVPALLEAAKLSVHESEDINSKYFFSLLFTSANLKLVHIVCHDKGEHHGAICIRNQYTTRTDNVPHFILNESVIS